MAALFDEEELAEFLTPIPLDTITAGTDLSIPLDITVGTELSPLATIDFWTRIVEEGVELDFEQFLDPIYSLPRVKIEPEGGCN
jgi:hypothetical protein